MTRLPELFTIGEGDDNNYQWGGRVSKGANQFLLDVQNEYDMNGKSDVIRFLVDFCYTYLPAQAAKVEDGGLSESMKATMAFFEADRRAKQREDDEQKLRERQARIAQVDHPETKRMLEESAKAYAESRGLQWPPPEAPLISYDPDCKYTLDKILDVMRKEASHKISLRSLNISTSFSRDKLIPILDKLSSNGYITFYEERRSGPPTIWIELPGRGESKNQPAMAKVAEMVNDEPF